MFKAADDRNYTLFTYVNELNQEVAKLEEQVQTYVYRPTKSATVLARACGHLLGCCERCTFAADIWLKCTADSRHEF